MWCRRGAGGLLHATPVSDFPLGLERYHALRWDHHRAHDPRWTDVTRPLHATLACVRAPVSAATLRAFIAAPDDTAVAFVLAAWSAFLITQRSPHTGATRYELLNPGFARFILEKRQDPSEGVDPDAIAQAILAALRDAAHGSRQPLRVPHGE